MNSHWIVILIVWIGNASWQTPQDIV